ncbi:hypothetical protein [Streptomyces sp. NPDC017260]|uniref:hypothetical protein n=1 Tax=unclassified Streptomyces TaxID=2593676 RepID=UPI00379B9C3B
MTDTFQYVPHVTTQFGDRDDVVEESWEIFRECNEGFAALRAFYTGRTPRPGRHDRCTQPLLMFARVQHHDQDEKLTHTTVHPNLLHPGCWAEHQKGRIFLTLPAVFPNEIGDAA